VAVSVTALLPRKLKKVEAVSNGLIETAGMEVRDLHDLVDSLTRIVLGRDLVGPTRDSVGASSRRRALADDGDPGIDKSVLLDEGGHDVRGTSITRVGVAEDDNGVPFGVGGEVVGDLSSKIVLDSGLHYVQVDGGLRTCCKLEARAVLSSASVPASA
jgi:hypothetical protein